MFDEKIRWLESLFGKGQYYSSSKELLVYCVFCKHHKRKLSINVETDFWKCWICNKNGKRLFYVIKEVGTRRDLDAYSKVHKSKHVIDKVQYHKDLDFFLDLPKEYVPLVECMNSVLGQRAFKYLTQTRGVEEEDILRFKIGILVSGDEKGSVIIPSFDSRGNLNWYSTRQIGSSFKTHPPVPKGYKNQIIPNDLNIDWSEPIVLVEGPFDWIKSINNTIPLYGNWLNPASVLFEQIARSEVPVFLALDADAMKQTHRIAKNFMRHPVPLYTMDVSPYKDLGEMTKQEARSRFESGSPLDRVEILRERIRALC